MFKKIIFFLAWVGIFLMSVIGVICSVGHIISANFPSAFLAARGINISSKMGNILILWLSVLYLIVCILKIGTKFQKDKNYEIQNENGIVSVSPQIVTDCVKDLLSDDKEITNIKVDAKKNGRKFDLLIKTAMSTDDNVANKSTEIQNKIKSQLSKKIGIDIGSVEVKLSKLSPKTGVEETNEVVSSQPVAGEDIAEDEKTVDSEPKESFFSKLFKKNKEEEAPTADQTNDESIAEENKDTDTDSNQ